MNRDGKKTELKGQAHGSHQSGSPPIYSGGGDWEHCSLKQKGCGSSREQLPNKQGAPEF
jgi:hypothetical protein